MGKAEKAVLMQNYPSPRWSHEITDCSMPMSMDTYSRCSYDCHYCFSFFQKSHSSAGYMEGQARSVKPQKVEAIFEAARQNNPELTGKSNRQFIPYIQGGRIMQWGGLADQFDENERRHGITLELLRYLDSIDYPLSFSTKATWWTEDERYMELFRRHSHNWHVKVSIICLDEAKAKQMERGVPSPRERLQAIKRLTDIGIRVTLRLRPYIIGLSEDWPDLIREAATAGADSVTTEFFCMETRADERLKERYSMMSKILGYDVFKFYMEQSKQQGYKRLTRAIKAPIIHRMRDFAHGLGMRFHVSDAFCRECNDAANCCGVPPEWGVSQLGHIGQAIIIAREKDEVHWSDISGDAERFFGFSWHATMNYNTGNNRLRSLLYDATMAQWIRANWNNTSAGTSPARGYGGILVASGVDDNGDVIYKLNPKLKKD